MDKLPPELDKYQVDDLFLLVGGNPLPNAVAGRTLLKKGGRIVLVYSDQTNDVRRQLKGWLEGTLKYRNKEATIDDSVRVEPADASSIYTKLKKEVDRINDSHRIGLHYTGGKKSMAVHAYRALADAARGKPPVMSYLDASTLTLRFDPPDPTLPSGDTIYVGDAITLKVDDLIALHGWRLTRGDPATTPLMPKTAQALLELYFENDEEQWQEWVQNCQNASYKVPLPNSHRLDAVAEALRNDLEGAVSQKKINLKKAAEANNFNSVGEFCDWFNGPWLESAVLSILAQIRRECNLNDRCMTFHVEPVKGGVEFEFDVVGMRGYQLFAFSCTTTGGHISNSKLKTKLFELYVRARQFGGTEARMALVCMVDNPDLFQRQIRRDIWADDIKRQRLRVFGRPHMNNLSRHISDWIKSQSGST